MTRSHDNTDKYDRIIILPCCTPIDIFLVEFTSNCFTCVMNNGKQSSLANFSSYWPDVTSMMKCLNAFPISLENNTRFR